MTIALYAIAWLFIGNLIRRASIRRWKKETTTVIYKISGMKVQSDILENKPTVRFWLLFPITAHYRDSSNNGGDPPMVAENWYCALLLLFWPLKVAFNLMALIVIFLSFLPRLLNYGLDCKSEVPPPPS